MKANNRKASIGILLLATCNLVACNSPELSDGYQVGDGLNMAVDGAERLHGAIQRYCSVASDDIARKAALQIIRLRYPMIPEDGICIDGFLNDNSGAQ